MLRGLDISNSDNLGLLEISSGIFGISIAIVDIYFAYYSYLNEAQNKNGEVFLISLAIVLFIGLFTSTFIVLINTIDTILNYLTYTPIKFSQIFILAGIFMAVMILFFANLFFLLLFQQ